MTYPLFHPACRRSHRMVLTQADFEQEFPGEGTHIEFKEGVSQDKVQEAVVGFSNKDGGVILVGVTDTGRVIGISDAGETERKLHHAVGLVNNPGTYAIYDFLVDQKHVLVLSVARRREGFAQTSSGAVRIRSGASNTVLLGEGLSRFLRERAFSHFETTETNIALAAASPRLVARLAAAYGWPHQDVEDRMLDAGFATVHGGQVVLTVAGALLLTDDPSRLGVKAQVEILRFPRDSEDPDKRLVVAGPLDDQVEGATKAVLAELGETSVLLGTRRVDMPKIPPTVIREAVANAVAHRSYETVGTGIRIEIRDDEVRIISPGALPEPVTEKNIRNSQASRNHLVLGALRRYGLAEDLGRGVDRIEDEMAAALLHPPEFHDNGSSVSVVLRLSGLVSPVERAWLSRLAETRDLGPNDGLVVVQCMRDGSITNSGVRSLLHIDTLEARSTLQRLRDRGLLQQQGERGGATYTVNKDLGMPAAIRLSREELEERALHLAAKRDIANSDVRGALGLERVEALELLQRLVDSGRLRRTGERRGTRYGLPPA